MSYVSKNAVYKFVNISIYCNSVIEESKYCTDIMKITF